MIRVAVFARAPTPGRAKTRLIPRLGAAGAARLHAAFVERAVATAVAAGVGPVTIWSPPEDAADPFLAACAARAGAARAVQRGDDLGARMQAAFEAGAPLLLMGCDAPSIAAEDLRACARALEGADAVFLPAEDGGYALVGAAAPPPIFAPMAWGGDGVMALTRRRLAEARLTWVEIRTVWDVDRPQDVDRLAGIGFSLPTDPAAD